MLRGEERWIECDSSASLLPALEISLVKCFAGQKISDGHLSVKLVVVDLYFAQVGKALQCGVDHLDQRLTDRLAELRKWLVNAEDANVRTREARKWDWRG